MTEIPHPSIAEHIGKLEQVLNGEYLMYRVSSVNTEDLENKRIHPSMIIENSIDLDITSALEDRRQLIANRFGINPRLVFIEPIDLDEVGKMHKRLSEELESYIKPKSQNISD